MLLTAAKERNWTLVKELIEKGADLQAKNNYGWTVLHYAAENGHLDTVKWLVEKGADVNAKTDGGSTVLSLTSNTEVKQWLREHGAINNDDMLTAAENGNWTLVKKLIEQGADLQAKNNNGWTVLHYAAWNGHLDTVKWLVEKGADLQAKDNHGWTALSVTSSNEVKQWLREHAAINIDNTLTAAKNGNWTLVKKLIDQGADLQAKNIYGERVLHWAVLSEHLDTVKWLVEQGADVQAKTNYGWTVLHLAARYGNLDTVKWLVEQGADVQAKDNSGSTAMSLTQNNEVKQWLREHGAT